MVEHVSDGRSRLALIADVGRTSVRIALTDDRGRLRADTVRAYEAATQSTLAGAMTAFGQESGLPKLPSRCAIAVSGAPRGDIITITNSRWHLSRSGLTSMLQAPPLILNDFAANAWAIADDAGSSRIEPISGAAVRPGRPGTYCIIGVGSGLGVALLSRDEHGGVNVLPTEAGHTEILAGTAEAVPIASILSARTGYLTAEMMLSAPGLLAIYQALAKLAGVTPTAANLPDLVRLGALGRDPTVAKACELFARALWRFAGNLVLAYGAWDGVILTGSVGCALRSVLRRPDLAENFVVKGPFVRQLRDVPRSLATFQHAELEGAAVALLMEDARLRAAPVAAGLKH